MEIIITDVTRFKDDSIRCIVGVEPKSGACVRPRPYLSAKDCGTHKIVPGSTLKGDFIPDADAVSPHIEDHRYSRISISGSVGSDDFKAALKTAIFQSIEDGFEIKLDIGEKHIPISMSPIRSVITISVSPSQIQVVSSQFKEASLKANLSDASGKYFSFLPVTDLGLNEYVQTRSMVDAVSEMNIFFRRQDEIYLRIGLSRPHRAPDGREGYWLQINGIYGFPGCFQKITSST